MLSEELLKRVYEIGAAAESSARSALASDSAQAARNARSEAENSAETAETYARAAASSAEEAQKASGLALDTTLTEDGKAADAKAAGDAVRELKRNCGELSSLKTTDRSSIVSAINEATQSAAV